MGSGAPGRSSLIGFMFHHRQKHPALPVQTNSTQSHFCLPDFALNILIKGFFGLTLQSSSSAATKIFFCAQQRPYPGKMQGGQLKRPGPPLGEHSVIQHTPSPSLHTPSQPAAEECPSPSKRKKSSDQVLDSHK